MNCLAKNNAQKTPFLRLSKAIVLRTCAYKTVFAQEKGLYVQKVAVYV